MNADVEMLGDEEGVLMDVRHTLAVEPVLESPSLGEDVVANPTARGKSGRGWFRLSVAVELEGKSGPGVARQP